ncbi:class I SAM-dependent methyltransferase [Roseobacter ponti]|uniref:Class I SAM-dependent methyltransferase n=1 Tax=Roseobacter ponti TaxID=1891787 RepID=A0A858SMQ3_9RHOB|nr:class I SAM-dependent methyltransferase [Roseobacter ponti]QJF50129.1 class I SAM-dependent methyltransferase [Roseobacter ponti]
MSDKETLSVYAARADEYSALADADTQSNPALAAFIAALPDGADVLDLGSGPGAAAAAMARAGLRATAWDPVAEMVTLAARNEGVAAEQKGFDDLTGTACYDGIWASFSLLHAPREAFPRYLAAIARALRPGGVFHIGMKTGTGSKRDGIGRLYTYYTTKELSGLLAAAGFTVSDVTTGEDAGLDGVIAPWVRIIARA